MKTEQEIIEFINKFSDTPKGFGFIPQLAKMMDISKGKGWLIELKEPLTKLGYEIIEVEVSSGLPDSTEYWWNYSEPTKYKIVKI
jgi:hypothetical protein